MAEQTLVVPDQVDGRTAAAILLAILDAEQASAIVSQLDPADLEALAAAMLEVEDVDVESMNCVLHRFAELAATPQLPVGKAAQRVGAIVGPVLGAAGADRLIGHLSPPRSLPAIPALRWMTADQIVTIILDEHCQAGALILARLDPAVAAQVLARIPETLRVDYLSRVASLGRVSDAALAMMDETLSALTATAPSGSAVEPGGASLAARICGNVPAEERQRLLKALAKTDKTLAAGIEEEMLTFQDLLALEAKSLGAIVRAVETPVLTVALRGLSHGDRERVFSCLSARAADSLRDELEDGEPVAMAEVRSAQSAIVAVARKLSDAGTIRLSQAGSDYV